MKNRTLKILTILSFVCLAFSILLSLFLTLFFGDENFSIFFNAVSGLGRNYYSPFPLLFDLGLILSGLLNFPFIFFFKKYLFEVEEEHIENEKRNLFKILSSLTFISVLSGNISLIGAGIFSLDRNIFYLHYIFALLLFSGYLFFAFFLGLLYLIYDLYIRKYLIIFGYGFLCSFFVLMYMAAGPFNKISLLFEWIIISVMFSWYYLFSLKLVDNYDKITKKD
ncbi:MAG: membrane protein of unknown function [Promethearchaeota archaeon]|nr:MAG: membrane protein of unknown function [Candidatus Lokiarchaeota archaeon]